MGDYIDTTLSPNDKAEETHIYKRACVICVICNGFFRNQITVIVKKLKNF